MSMFLPPSLHPVERDWGSHGVRRHLLAAVDRPRALAIELHGSGLDPERQDAASGLAAALARRGIATVIPQGAIPFQLLPVEAPGYVWNVPGVPLPLENELRLGLPDDAGWICDLADHVRDHFSNASLPIMIAGYSAGARLASQIVTGGRLEWAGAAFVAGLRPAASLRRTMPPTIALHGRDDLFAPYGGGQPPRWAEGVEDAALAVARQAGINAAPELESIAGGTRQIFRANDGSTALVQYMLDGAGHAWPGSRDERHCAIYRAGCTDVDASEEIAGFFSTILER